MAHNAQKEAEKVDELQEAIDGWRALASGADPMLNDYMRQVCERTAQSLEIARDTGVAVCVCCFKQRVIPA